MNRNKFLIAILATVIAGGAIFYACKKDNKEESVTSKIEKGSTIVPEDQIYKADKEVCYSISLKWGHYSNYFMVSYLDADGTTIFYFVSPDTKLGLSLSKIFLKKIKTFSGTEKEYCEWAEAEREKGNIVVGYKDDKGLHHGKSYTESEWSLYLIGVR